jgi:hypothetical protein
MADVTPTDLPAGTTPATPAAPVPGGRPRTKRFWWVLGTIVFVIAAALYWVGQQSQPKFPPAPAVYCKASKRFETEIDRQAAVRKIDVAKQVELVDALVVAADEPGRRRVPADVRADLATFAEAMHRAEAGTAEKDDPEIQAAVDRVNRYSSQACGVFARRGL